MRWEVPLWRLILQPIRSNAAKACFDLTEGHCRDGLSGGKERHVQGAGDRLAVLQAVGNQPQR